MSTAIDMTLPGSASATRASGCSGGFPFSRTRPGALDDSRRARPGSSLSPSSIRRYPDLSQPATPLDPRSPRPPVPKAPTSGLPAVPASSPKTQTAARNLPPKPPFLQPASSFAPLPTLRPHHGCRARAPADAARLQRGHRLRRREGSVCPLHFPSPSSALADGNLSRARASPFVRPRPRPRPAAKISSFFTQFVKEPRARGADVDEEDEDEGLELDEMELDDEPAQRFKYMRALVRPLVSPSLASSSASCCMLLPPSLTTFTICAVLLFAAKHRQQEADGPDD